MLIVSSIFTIIAVWILRNSFSSKYPSIKSDTVIKIPGFLFLVSCLSTAYQLLFILFGSQLLLSNYYTYGSNQDSDSWGFIVSTCVVTGIFAITPFVLICFLILLYKTFNFNQYTASNILKFSNRLFKCVGILFTVNSVIFILTPIFMPSQATLLIFYIPYALVGFGCLKYIKNHKQEYDESIKKMYSHEQSKQKTKICPYCGEEILAVAQKCKYCGEWLNK